MNPKTVPLFFYWETEKKPWVYAGFCEKKSDKAMFGQIFKKPRIRTIFLQQLTHHPQALAEELHTLAAVEALGLQKVKDANAIR